MLSAYGRGAYESLEEAAAKYVRKKGSIQPNPELMARYEEKYQSFRRIYPALRDVFGSL